MSINQEFITLKDILSELVGGEIVEIDSALHQCVTNKMEQRKGAMTTTVSKKNKASNRSNIRQRDNIADRFRGEIINRDGNYVVEDPGFGRNVIFHQGNNYGFMRWLLAAMVANTLPWMISESGFSIERVLFLCRSLSNQYVFRVAIYTLCIVLEMLDRI